MPKLTAARYGKDNVRVCKVDRDLESGVQNVTEMTVCCLLEGDVETSYTEADNSVVVATDSVKNTIYIKAKEHAVNPPEVWATRLGQHFLDTYTHIHTVHVSLHQHQWQRMHLPGQAKPHPHSFIRTGSEVRTVEAVVDRKSGIALRSGIAGLTVLKTTGSAFHSFVRDDFTTLKDTWDRILSTDVDCVWAWAPFESCNKVIAVAERFEEAWRQARDVTLSVFAEDESASVQATMYKMCERILEAVREVEKVKYMLPNKHYFEVDLNWHKGLKNTGKDAEVYAPQTDPNGRIECEVARS